MVGHQRHQRIGARLHLGGNQLAHHRVEPFQYLMRGRAVGPFEVLGMIKAGEIDGE